MTASNRCPLCGNPQIGCNLDCSHCRVVARKNYRGRPTKINLYLDDVRGCPFPGDTEGPWYESRHMKIIPDEPGEGIDWFVVRTYARCIEMLQQEAIGTLSLDHDIADYSPEKGREVTGYDVLCWLEEQLDRDINFPIPNDIRVHSANPVGRKRMASVIERLARKRDLLARMNRRQEDTPSPSRWGNGLNK